MPTSPAPTRSAPRARRKPAFVGPFVALLATREVRTAADRLGNSRGWVRTDGLPLADRPLDVADGNLFYPLRIDENGEDLGAGEERFAIGSIDANNATGDCTSYSDPAAVLTAVRVDTTGSTWRDTIFNFQPCTASVHVACFGIGFDAVLAPPGITGRRAFVTTQDFVPGGGLAAADALCAQEAQLAGVGGQFLALLGTGSAPASARFDLARPTWQRVDGVALASSPLAFIAGELDATFDMTALGTPVRTDVMTGGLPSSTPVGTGGPCAEWTSPGGNIVTGASNRSGPEAFDVTVGACTGPIYCLEQ